MSDVLSLIQSNDSTIESMHVQRAPPIDSIQQMTAYVYTKSHVLHCTVECKQLGMDIGSNTTIKNLVLLLGGYIEDEEEKSGIVDFYDGLKNNSSIEELQLEYKSGSSHRRNSIAHPPFDLNTFLVNNTNDVKLVIRTCEPCVTSLEGVMTREHVNAIATGLNNHTLAELDVSYCLFDSMDSLGKIISAPRGVKKITGLPNELIQKVTKPNCWSFDQVKIEATDFIPLFGLCDYSSIENICNSNHVLEEVCFKYSCRKEIQLPDIVSDCLKLNRNCNKADVIRRKIVKYYFQGDFDESPFTCMNISFLPNILALIGTVRNVEHDSFFGWRSKYEQKIRQEAREIRKAEKMSQQVALYRMLQKIPSLCNVSGRNAGNGPDLKRQKVTI